MNSLKESGKIREFLPGVKASANQKYVTAGYEPPIPTVEEIVRYCAEPRTKGQIAVHFNITGFLANKYYRPLIDDGRLTGIDNDYSERNSHVRLVDSRVDIARSRTERIVRFCNAPRTREEIADFLKINHDYANRIILDLVKRGQLKAIRPEMTARKTQRFIDAKIDVPIFGEAEILAYCAEPKSMKEIVANYGVTIDCARKTVVVLIKAGKITYTESVNNRRQKYVAVSQSR
jgi:DNA-binding MarR family transcriptional regulator